VRIKLDEIPASGLFFRVDDDSWVSANDFVCQGPVQATVSLGKDGGRILLAGTLHLTIVLECDRCLDSFTYIVDEEFEVVFELLAKEEEASVASDHFCKGSELDVEFLAEPVVDIFSVLAQQLYLALPDKKLCCDNCLGLCPECGANLNRFSCNCARGSGASPFNVLAKLKVH